MSWQPAFPRHDAEPCSSPAASSRDEDTLWSLGCVRTCISSSLALRELWCAHSTDLPVLQEHTGVHTTPTVKCHRCLLLHRAYLIKVWQTVEPQSTQICCKTQIPCWNQVVFLKIIPFICNPKRDCSLLTKAEVKWLSITFHQNYVGSARSKACLQLSFMQDCDVTNTEIRFHWQIK